ncbi:MAG: hypothetical protein K8U03_15355 [Planctomycetia bacterium]|nr:hypothetical protein [Planctomycetia bacterium]
MSAQHPLNVALDTPVAGRYETADATFRMSTRSRFKAVLDVLLVFAVFFLIAGRPTPDTNEAHYLTKAKHFWEPRWIEHDFFLSSSDSHVVFYRTFGWLTTVLSFDRAAWCGRIAIWFLTACAWRRLSQVFVTGFGSAAITAVAALSLNAHFQMSGEWFVGGCEAKGVAYACVFWGLADLVLCRWNQAFIAFGIGSAFHVLVGGWSVLAAGFVWLGDRRSRPALKQIVPGLCVGGLIALAGIVPGLALSRGVDSESVAIANRIYVFDRLAHHLWAGAFFAKFGLRHFALCGAWGLLCCIVPADGPRRRLRWFTLASITASLGGLAISYASPEPTSWAAALLKFYWFRLSDVVTAVSVVLELAAVAAQQSGRPVLRKVAIGLLLLCGGLHFASIWRERSAADGLPRGEAVVDAPTLERWLDVCRWIRQTTPRDALVLAPRAYTTFKWHAERAEFVTWKDIPQDARSLLEWERRLQELYGPNERWVNYIPHDQMLRVCRKYGITHVVTYAEPPLALPVVYRNDVYVVYAVEPRGDGP